MYYSGDLTCAMEAVVRQVAFRDTAAAATHREERSVAELAPGIGVNAGVSVCVFDSLAITCAPEQWTGDHPHVVTLLKMLTSFRAITDRSAKPVIRILDHLIERAGDDGVLAGSRGEISSMMVANAAGVSRYMMRDGGPAQLALSPWLPYFKGPVRSPEIAADPRNEGATDVARVRALLRDKAKRSEPLVTDSVRRGSASMRAIADETGIRFSRLRGNPHVRGVVRDALASGLVSLGPVYQPTGPAISEERLAELRAVAMSFDVDGAKVPENPNRQGAPDFDRIAELTGKPGLNGKESYGYTQFVLEIARRRGTELPGVTASTDSFSALMTFGLKSVETEQKARGLATWANGVANHKSALDRFCDQHNLTLEDEAEDWFGDKFDANVEKAAEGLGSGATGNFERAMRKWRELRVQRFDLPELPPHFGPALQKLIDARGYTVATMARKVEMCVSSLRGWIAERSGVSSANIDKVARIERELKVPAGTLLTRLTHVSGRIDRIQGATDEYVALNCRVRALLPLEAASWKAEPLADAVVKVSPLLRAGTTFGDLMQLTRAEENRLSPFAPSDRVRKQLASYETYKTVAMPYPLLRTRRWMSKHSSEKGMTQLTTCLRFACIERGGTAWSGLGLPRDLQTLAWMSVCPIALAYAGQRAKRFADMDWKGERRGTFYTESETSFLEHMMSMTNPATGYLVQHPELASELTPLKHSLPPQFDDLLTFHAMDREAPLLSDADVAAARADWAGWLKRSHDHYVQARSAVIDISAISRNPYESVAGLMLADEPMAEYLALLFAVEKRWASPRTSKDRWRIDVRDSVIGRLAPITGFRPSNVMGLTFTGDHRGKIRNVDGIWEIEVPFREFKNWPSCRLFGTRTSPKNFKMQLRDECGLYDVLGNWFYEGLPGLRAKGDHRPAFVNRYGDPMTVSAYGDMMQVFGAKHIAWNPVLQTGFPGVTSMNPYQVRHLRASDTLQCSKAANKVEEAAFAIQTSERMIIDHYGFLVPERAILDGYDTFSEQARKAWAKIRI